MNILDLSLLAATTHGSTLAVIVADVLNHDGLRLTTDEAQAELARLEAAGEVDRVEESWGTTWRRVKRVAVEQGKLF